jgi:NTP-dependent ternary system trypsin peptidase co-occuring protein
MGGSEDWMPLRDFVSGLRAELRAAHDDAAQAERSGPAGGPKFVVGPVNVEFTVVAKKEAGANGGVRFYVFELGASGSVGSEATQRVSLQLNPVGWDGDPYDIARESAATQE